jgi:hypothetical protein
VQIAIVATLFVSAVLLVFDASHPARLRLTRLAISVNDSRLAYERIMEAFPTARIIELPNTNPEPGRMVLDVVLGETTDAATVLQLLQAKEVPGIRSVNLEAGRAA